MLINTDLDAIKELQYELLPDEKLLWAGRPKRGFILRPSDFFLIPFSVFWFSFAVFWETSVISSGAPLFFMLWGVPFICVGLYITVGRFFYDMLLRANTVYGITQNRIIIKAGAFKKTVDTLNIRTLQNLNISEKRDGSGTITLTSNNFPFGAFAIKGWPGRKQGPELELIQDVRDVYDLILKQQHYNPSYNH